MFHATFRRTLVGLALSLGLAGSVIAAPVSMPVVTTSDVSHAVAASNQMGISRHTVVGPFESDRSVLRTDTFVIGGTKATMHMVGSVKIEQRHLREVIDVGGMHVYKTMGNGKFTETHRPGIAANLSLKTFCEGYGKFATEVIITVYPKATYLYRGYKPTRNRNFYGSDKMHCDDRRILPTANTPIPAPRKPGGGSW